MVYSPWALVRGLQVEAAEFTGRCVLCCIFEHGAWVYSPRCGVYRLRRRGLQIIRFYVVWVSGVQLRVYRRSCGFKAASCRFTDTNPRVYRRSCGFTGRNGVFTPRQARLLSYVDFASFMGAWFAARGAGFTGRGGGVYRSLRFMLMFRALGQGLQPDVAGFTC